MKNRKNILSSSKYLFYHEENKCTSSIRGIRYDGSAI
jgi:hypothetical protein